MKADNPFTLTFGRQPSTAITRIEDTSQIAGSFSANNPICQTYLISGLRGSRKTVLMTSVANELQKKGLSCFPYYDGIV